MSSGLISKIRRSLAFRLILSYAGIFSITSCVAFLLFYLFIDSDIKKRTDNELLSQMGTFDSIMAAKGVDAVRTVAMLEAQASGERKIFYRIYYNYRWMYFSSDTNFWEAVDISQDALQQLSEGRKRVFETVEIPGHAHPVRILYGLIGPGVILQIGQSMAHHTQFFVSFQKTFILTMSGLILLAGLIGWFMARQALSGLEDISRTARSISKGDLGKRVPVKSRGHEIDLLSTTLNDMLDQIQDLIKGMKEMCDNIAHDLKSPITTIRGLSEINLTQATSIAEYEHMAGSIIEECDRLLDMINTMLMISETDAGIAEFSSEEIRMVDVVRDACTLFQPLADEKGLSLQFPTSADGAFKGNLKIIQRMVANLVDNAIKYTPYGGAITVSIETSGEKWFRITFQDTGPGIAAKDMPHIFERFYRCDTSRSHSGSGLGLSLARAIARAHGGDITVSSAPDQGSRFTITLPKKDFPDKRQGVTLL